MATPASATVTAGKHLQPRPDNEVDPSNRQRLPICPVHWYIHPAAVNTVEDTWVRLIVAGQANTGFPPLLCESPPKALRLFRVRVGHLTDPVSGDMGPSQGHPPLTGPAGPAPLVRRSRAAPGGSHVRASPRPARSRYPRTRTAWHQTDFGSCSSPLPGDAILVVRGALHQEFSMDQRADLTWELNQK